MKHFFFLCDCTTWVHKNYLEHLYNYTVKCHRKLHNSTKFISCIYSIFEKYLRDLYDRFRYESLMQLSVWLIRDCIPNWLNNAFFFKAALSEDNSSLAGDLVTIPSMGCLILLSLKHPEPTVASKAHDEIKGPLLLTVLEKHFVQWPNRGNVFIGTWK